MKMKIALLSTLLLAMWLPGCASQIPDDAPPAHMRPNADNLDLLTAQRRSQQLSAVRYAIELTVDAQSPDYSGAVDIHFNYRPGNDPVTIDFGGGGQVDEVEINGSRSKYTFNGHFISLAPGALKTGPNTLRIRYRHPWSQVGAGLYRFTDPADGKVYFYSQFEIYDANRAFPSFDQPDLKATYTLAVTAPASWTLVSAARETGIEDQGDTRRWQFPETARFSTYVMSLHGGEYVVWEDPDAHVPARLFARASMAQYVPVDDWFRWTRQGFDFFEQWFGVDYPYGKYDQLLVPDYQFGAMENVGAVTFAERLIGRGGLTESQRLNLADTIMHEMAHMWFGDLVTMQWWNGLWLNESFATYMAALASHEALGFDNAWHSYFSGMKTWGYYEDALVTTHPIEVDITDVRAAFSSFDGISYGKGAAVLKQLAHRVGADEFRAGMQRYMQTHAGGNATLEDLVAALQLPADEGERWVNDWLLTPGTNTLSARHRCFNKLLAGISIEQSAPEQWPVLRQHRISLATYNSAGENTATDDLLVDHARTELDVPALSTCPAFVFPNHNDHSFARIRFSDTDLAFLRSNAVQIADPLTRDMIWQSLWSMVIDAEYGLDEFLALASRALPLEKDSETLRSIQRYARYGANITLEAWPQRDYPLVLGELLAGLGDIGWRQLKKAEANSDLQKIWLDFVIAVADDATTLRRLQQLVDDPVSVLGNAPDADRRWRILSKLARHRYPGTRARANTMLASDNSDSARKYMLQIDASLATGERKRELLGSVLGESGLTTSEAQTLMGSLFPITQLTEKRQHSDVISAAIPTLDKSESPYFMTSLVESLAPAFCDIDSSRALGQLLDDNPELSEPSRKSLLVAKQDNERCTAIRERVLDRE